MPSSGALARKLPLAVQVAIVAGVYFIAARLSLALAIPPGYATAVWPPSGIALAAALALGWRIWPGIWLGAALANVMVESSALPAALIASGNTLEALAGAALIRRHVGDPGRFERAEGVVGFILACALSAAIAATVAAAALQGHTQGPDELLRIWWTWWQGDATGMIVVAPLILSWAAPAGAPWPARRKLEAAAFAALLAFTVAAIAADRTSAFAPFSLTFVALPFILWAAFRFGQREVTSAIAVVCAVAIGYVIERRELFAGVALNELLLMLLTFISMVVTTGLVLVTALSGRARSAEALRVRHQTLQSQVRRHTHYDALTGLPNALLFRERLARFLEVAARHGTGVAVAVVDIDRFKTINEALGREAGDELLREMARRLSRNAFGGLVARIDGVQFAVAWFAFDGAGAAERDAEARLARWFGAPLAIGGHEFRLSGRAGLALFPDHGAAPDALFMHAESALKSAKAAGERYLFFAPTMQERLAEKLALENRLRRALEREEFVLHYQPKLDLDSRRIVGVEALIRWRSPDAGLVAPMEFIPLLEETGLIVEVGMWVIRRAMRDQAAWAAAGARAPRVAVNVSSIQVRQRNFVELLRAEVGAGPAAIDLEITESHIMEDVEVNIGKLERLRELGVGIAIDDFGTGYSSLAYLARLPVQILKIDRTFIVRMLDDEDAMALVQTILSLARTLGLTVIAEGVETEEQAEVLATLRCDQVQGYYVSPPRPADEIAALLRG
ncbi:MAG TPA: EAL domain-containing protein [Burkholderiales bacterium]|nr:EAL domain-containing protein [Burkholderiales bacterium]